MHRWRVYIWSHGRVTRKEHNPRNVCAKCPESRSRPFCRVWIADLPRICKHGRRCSIDRWLAHGAISHDTTDTSAGLEGLLSLWKEEMHCFQFSLFIVRAFGEFYQYPESHSGQNLCGCEVIDSRNKLCNHVLDPWNIAFVFTALPKQSNYNRGGRCQQHRRTHTINGSKERILVNAAFWLTRVEKSTLSTYLGTILLVYRQYPLRQQWRLLQCYVRAWWMKYTAPTKVKWVNFLGRR